MQTAIHSVSAVEPALKILVVDDAPANLKMMRSALEMVGHSVLTANSGEDALLCFQHEKPDVILMDVMMPGMGGIEATRRLREMAGERWLPILFVSALSDSEDMVRGLETGGDDYLPKPVDISLLLAKIRALQRVAVLQKNLHLANVELEAYRKSSEHNMALASAVMERMIQSASMAVEGVELWLQPAAELSGDLLAARKGSDGRTYLLLADAMGHGLPAALPVMPLIQVFATMAQNGYTVPAIAREMNSKLKELLPAGNFVAVTLVGIDRANRLLDIWNGGNPSALLVAADGKVRRRFAARHVALGILADAEFDATTEACQWGDEEWFMLCSDGLMDARDCQDQLFGETRLLASLESGAPHEKLKESVLAHLDGCAASDDISLATVCLGKRSCP